MSTESNNKKLGLKHRKYTKEQWANFLKEAYDRIESQKRFVNREEEFSDIEENTTNKLISPYKCYENEIVEFMRKFESEHHEVLENAHSSYKNGKSAELFESRFQLMDESKMKRLFKHCKILIVTANPIEKATLHHCICQKNSKQKILRFICDSNVYYMFKWGKYRVVHVHQPQTGANKDLGMNATIYEALKYIKPNVIFSMGVAFGIDYKTQNIGDVLVSRQIFPYSENKRNGEKIQPDRTQDKTIDNWLDIRFANANGFLDEVTYGGILSGGSVLSSSTEKDKLCTAYFDDDSVIGGEMEGSGLFQTSYYTDIPCAVIKGICDWGVAKNDIFGKETIEDGTLKEEWFKECLQAYAMSQVVEKCEPLFRDKTLFSATKNREAEREKKKSKMLLTSNLLSILCMLAISILLLFRFEQYYAHHLIIILPLLCVSIICILLILIALLKKNKSEIETHIQDMRENMDFIKYE